MTITQSSASNFNLVVGATYSIDFDMIIGYPYLVSSFSMEAYLNVMNASTTVLQYIYPVNIEIINTRFRQKISYLYTHQNSSHFINFSLKIFFPNSNNFTLNNGQTNSFLIIQRVR